MRRPIHSLAHFLLAVSISTVLSPAADKVQGDTSASSDKATPTPLKVIYFGRVDRSQNGNSVAAGGKRVQLEIRLNRRVSRSDLDGNSKALEIRIEPRRLLRGGDFLDAVAAVQLADDNVYWDRDPAGNEMAPAQLVKFRVGQKVGYTGFFRLSPNAAQGNGTATPLEFPEYTMLIATIESQSQRNPLYVHVLTTLAPGQQGETEMEQRTAGFPNCSGWYFVQGVSDNGDIQEAFEDAVGSIHDRIAANGCSDIIFQTRLLQQSVQSEHGGIQGLNRLELWVEAWWGDIDRTSMSPVWLGNETPEGDSEWQQQKDRQ